LTNISDRLSKIADNENISTRNFEQIIGCSNGVLSRAILKSTDISSTWLTKIVESFPKYDAHWLLTGDGNMIRETPAPDKNPPEYIMKTLLQQIKDLAAENALLKAEISALKTSKKYGYIPGISIASEPEK
jgi:hypothetical protein